MFVVLGKNPDIHYRILLILGEIFCLLSIILIGLLFNKNVSNSIYDWKKNPFSYHPLMMTIGLLFCYGNGIILYRTFKKTPKYSIKIFHGSLLIFSLIFSLIGLIAIIRQKILLNNSHLLTYHSWIGLTTIILFVFQWISGFVSFLFPQLSLDFRKAYMPTHRFWGKVIFFSGVIAILTGVSEYGMRTSFIAPNDGERTRRLIMNFFCVFTSLFCLIVIYFLSNPEYQRPSEVILDRSAHHMEQKSRK